MRRWRPAQSTSPPEVSLAEFSAGQLFDWLADHTFTAIEGLPSRFCKVYLDDERWHRLEDLLHDLRYGGSGSGEQERYESILGFLDREGIYDEAIERLEQVAAKWKLRMDEGREHAPLA